ncbi:MAG: hypothetical protein QG573_2233 [Acidobacteriota bacterium]|nr:hypothetical protein [Acidobacteriota bacterium]
MDDRDLLERRRQEKIEPLPAEEERRRNHRVLHQHAQRQKDRAVAGDGQHGDAEIGERLPGAGAAEQVGPPAFAHRRKEAERELQHHRKPEKRAARDDTGEVLADHEDVAPQRREKVEVEAALEHLAANEVGEDSEAAEEDDEAQEEELKEDAIGLRNIAGLLHRERLEFRRQDTHRQQQHRQQRHQHDRQRPRPQEGLAQLEPEHGADLTHPAGESARLGSARRFARRVSLQFARLFVQSRAPSSSPSRRGRRSGTGRPPAHPRPPGPPLRSRRGPLLPAG